RSPTRSRWVFQVFDALRWLTSTGFCLSMPSACTAPPNESIPPEKSCTTSMSFQPPMNGSPSGPVNLSCSGSRFASAELEGVAVVGQESERRLERLDHLLRVPQVGLFDGDHKVQVSTPVVAKVDAVG